MPKNNKAIKSRISSVKSTKKITRSMQMIAASKMQKTVNLATSSKAYSDMASNLMSEVNRINTESYSHPLMAQRKNKDELLVVLSSNRGLCGNFNDNVISIAERYIKDIENSVNLHVLAIGKKSAAFAQRNGLPLVSLYDGLSDNPTYDSISSIAKSIISDFETKIFDKVTVIYTKFINSFYQEAVSQSLLPIQESFLKAKSYEVEKEQDDFEYKLEPDVKSLLDYLLPRIIEAEMYQFILDSAASEHSSRMIAMKNATDAASDMVEGLTLEYNKSRQAAITQEVSEIVGGIEALSN